MQFLSATTLFESLAGGLKQKCLFTSCIKWPRKPLSGRLRAGKTLGYQRI